MGVWDTICYVGDGVKGITPDLSTVKRAGSATYYYTSAAFGHVDQVVRVNGIQKLPRYWPDGEARAQIGLFTTTLAKNTAKYAVYEGFKHIPGVSVASKLVSQTMHEVKRENQKDRVKVVQAKVDQLEKDLKKSNSQPETFLQNTKLSTQNAGGGGAEKAEDVINVFLKTEFMGNHMFRDLMIPTIKKDE